MDRLAIAEKKIQDLRTIISFLISCLDPVMKEYVLKLLEERDEKPKVDSRYKNKGSVRARI